jgi:CubicO group peptidase (beta-lactamase class C family)
MHLTNQLRNALPIAPPGIQVQNLLSHTSGFRFKGNWQIENGRSRDHLIRHLIDQKIGKHEFLYSNVAFSLLENIVEHEIQAPWPKVFHETLAKRGLGHIALSTLDSKASVAYPHHPEDKHRTKFVSFTRLPKNYPEQVSSSAGVFASLNDLIKFAQIQFTPDLAFLHLPRVSANDIYNCKKGIFPDSLPRSQVRSSYALGWRVLEHETDKHNSTRLTFHGGYLKGVSAFVGLIKDQELAVIAVRNDQLISPMKITMSTWSAFLKAVSVI